MLIANGGKKLSNIYLPALGPHLYGSCAHSYLFCTSLSNLPIPYESAMLVVVWYKLVRRLSTGKMPVLLNRQDVYFTNKCRFVLSAPVLEVEAQKLWSLGQKCGYPNQP